MYLRILKKDLKRKRSMNIILLIFITLAATFIASSMNNMVTVTKALDTYFEKANAPDYWFITTDEEHLEKYEKMADKEGYQSETSMMHIINSSDVFVKGRELDYDNTLVLSGIEEKCHVFMENDEELQHVEKGEVWMPSIMFYGNDYKVGDVVKITVGEMTKEFKIAGCVKDVMMGGAQIGLKRIIISDEEMSEFEEHAALKMHSVMVYDIDEAFREKFLDLGLSTIVNVDRAMLKMIYVYDMIVAGIMIVVSVCLVAISMVILRFTINFTMSEEFREIGVMKAIGLKNSNIRMLYIVKYLAIAVLGAIIGFFISIPFGAMLMASVSTNIIIYGNGYVIINGLCAVLTAGIVVLFCYMCTGRIKHFSPIEAIRNGENGERFRRKSIISLGKVNAKPAWFMAFNDIFSDIRRYVIMIIIFALGLLLIIIPVNSINTLSDDSIMEWFNMAFCHHYVSVEEMHLSTEEDKGESVNKQLFMKRINKIKSHLAENGVEADVFQEIMFRTTIFFDEKRTSSGAFIGLGDVTTDDYVYIEGTAPAREGEIAMTKYTAGQIDAGIGDTVEVVCGNDSKEYIITAFYQSMNNMGEGVRFYHKENLDFKYVAGYFTVQVRYWDEPDQKQLQERKELLQGFQKEGSVYDPGEYVNEMLGDISSTLSTIKNIILIVVIAINALVTVLMVKSFISKEKGQIAMMKAIGFNNGTLLLWQTVRIGVVILIAAIIAIILSTPLSQLTCGPIFKMMGAHSIKFAIKPLEVYVMYPVIILCVTLVAAWLSAQQVRRIKAADTANIE